MVDGRRRDHRRHRRGPGRRGAAGRAEGPTPHPRRAARHRRQHWRHLHRQLARRATPRPPATQRTGPCGSPIGSRPTTPPGPRWPRAGSTSSRPRRSFARSRAARRPRPRPRRQGRAAPDRASRRPRRQAPQAPRPAASSRSSTPTPPTPTKPNSSNARNATPGRHPADDVRRRPRQGPRQVHPRRPDRRDAQEGPLALAAPKHRASQGPLGERRPTPERLGQAFTELIQRYPTKRLPKAGGLNATVVVLMPLDTLMGGLKAAQLDTGEPISPGQARRLACEAGIIPAVLGGKSQVLDLGRKQPVLQRNPPDQGPSNNGGCAVEGCDWPPGMTHMHHPTRWADGGGNQQRRDHDLPTPPRPSPRHPLHDDPTPHRQVQLPPTHLGRAGATSSTQLADSPCCYTRVEHSMRMGVRDFAQSDAAVAPDPRHELALAFPTERRECDCQVCSRIMVPTSLRHTDLALRSANRCCRLAVNRGESGDWTPREGLTRSRS